MYRRIFFFPLLLPLFLFGYLQGQSTFQLTYGGANVDGAYGIADIGNGRYAVTGQTESFTSNEIQGMAMVIDGDGNVIWAVHSGANGDEEGSDCAVVGNRLFFTGGTTEAGPASGNGFLQVYDLSNGALLNSTSAGIAVLEQLVDVDASPSGHVFASGFSFQNNLDIFLTKWDTTGNLLWGRTLGSAQTGELAFEGLATSDGGYLAFGATSQGVGSDDCIFVKVDSNGSIEWSRIFGTISTDFPADAVETAEGYAVTGRTNAGGSNDVFLLRLDTAGQFIDARLYQAAGSDVAYNIETDGEDYFIAGQTTSFGFGTSSGFLMRTDSVGGIIFTKAYGGSGGETLLDLVLPADGGILAVGTSNSGTTDDDIWIVRTDDMGESGCNDTAFALTNSQLSFFATAPSNIVSTPAGTSLAKSWTAPPAAFFTDTTCFNSGCAITAAATLIDTNLCPGDTLFASASPSPGSSFDWLVNGTPLDTGLTFAYIPPSPGSYTLQLAATDSNCTDTAAYPFSLFPEPTLFGNLIACAGDTLLLTNTTPGASSASWLVNGNLVATGLIAMLPPSTAGTPALTMLSDPGGCPLDTNIVVNSTPIPDYFSVQTGFIMEYFDQSIGGDTWLWDFGDGGSSTQQNPTHIYATNGNYTVCLTVTSSQTGCSDSICKTEHVVVGVEEALANGMEAWPLPFGEELKVSVPAGVVVEEVELWGMEGKMLGRWEMPTLAAGQFVIRPNALPRGLYSLRVRGLGWEGRIKVAKE